MSRALRKQMLTMLNLLEKASITLNVNLTAKRVDIDGILQLLSDCQETAIAMGSELEMLYGEGTDVVHKLEDYCESLYQMTQAIPNPEERRSVLQDLTGSVKKARKLVGELIPDRREAVFLPYKASMWDSLESVWMVANEEEDCDVYVVPIPYYDRNPDGTFSKYHYEGDEMPDYVPVTHYENYDIQKRWPDMVFIYNLYDQYNYVTSVDPRFYSTELKKRTYMLVYIPYFVLGEVDPENEKAVEGMAHFCTMSGVLNADKVVVQSGAMPAMPGGRKTGDDTGCGDCIAGKENLSMKKSIAVLLAVLIGISYCLPGNVAMAADGTKEVIDTENTEADQVSSVNDENSSVDQVISADERDISAVQVPSEGRGSSLIDRFWKKITGTGEKEDLQKSTESEIQQKAKIEDQETVDSLESDIKNLQIPQKLAVVIDPWEMDGKGQVYSELYVIRNTGDNPGILTLSNLACKPREQSGVVVKTDKEGLHDSGDKSIYMEMLLGNENRIIFSTEKSQYQTELKPGEELAISFEGEVNENAFGEWTNQDVAISLVYSWEMKEELDDLNQGEEQTSDSDETEVNEQDEQQQTDASEEEPDDRQQIDTSRGEPLESQQTGTDDAEDEQKVDPEEERQESNFQEETGKELSDTLQTGVSQESINEEEQTVSSDEIEREIKNIDLHEPQKVDVNIDSWKTDEKGRIVSQQYLLYNVGDSTGIWTLSDIICKPQEKNGVRITTDKKALHDSEEKAVYMELLLGNGEKVILSQESSIYEVKLEPGEKLEVCFIGEKNGNLFENREEGDIAVTAVCSWNTD